MSMADIKEVRRAHADPAIRVVQAGFEWLKLHFVHSYLRSSFFSPLVNQRGMISAAA